MGEILIRNRIFYIASKYFPTNKVLITMGKLATWQWKSLADTTLSRWSKFTSLLMGQTDIVRFCFCFCFWCDKLRRMHHCMTFFIVQKNTSPESNLEESQTNSNWGTFYKPLATLLKNVNMMKESRKTTTQLLFLYYRINNPNLIYMRGWEGIVTINLIGIIDKIWVWTGHKTFTHFEILLLGIHFSASLKCSQR